MATIVCGGCGRPVSECRATRPVFDRRAALEEVHRTNGLMDPRVEEYLLGHGEIRRVTSGDLAGKLVRTFSGDQTWARLYNAYLAEHPAERARVHAKARD